MLERLDNPFSVHIARVPTSCHLRQEYRWKMFIPTDTTRVLEPAFCHYESNLRERSVRQNVNGNKRCFVWRLSPAHPAMCVRVYFKASTTKRIVQRAQHTPSGECLPALLAGG